jgi:hypothetical protein
MLVLEIIPGLVAIAVIAPPGLAATRPYKFTVKHTATAWPSLAPSRHPDLAGVDL